MLIVQKTLICLNYKLSDIEFNKKVVAISIETYDQYYVFNPCTNCYTIVNFENAQNYVKARKQFFVVMTHKTHLVIYMPKSIINGRSIFEILILAFYCNFINYKQ